MNKTTALDNGNRFMFFQTEMIEMDNFSPLLGVKGM
jgi:hypothetical protein